MWQKRTEPEIAKAKARAKRSRLLVAISVGVLLAGLLTFTYGSGPARHSTRFPTWGEIPVRLPFGVIAGAIAGVIAYRLRLFGRQTMVCPKCDQTKVDDKVKDCSCGGEFVEIETVKRV